MSKKWNKQKRDINAEVDFINNNGGTSLSGPFMRDRIKRVTTSMAAENAKKENAEKRGNPLSIIANEKRPNPARRMKMMAAARRNKRA